MTFRVKTCLLCWLGMLASVLYACACYFFWTHRDVPKNSPFRTSAGRRSNLSDGYRTPAARVPRLSGAATNSTASVGTPLSFAHLLSPAATNYQGSIRALQALPPVLSAEQVEVLRDVLAVTYDPPTPTTPSKTTSAMFMRWSMGRVKSSSLSPMTLGALCSLQPAMCSRQSAIGICSKEGSTVGRRDSTTSAPDGTSRASAVGCPTIPSVFPAG